MTQPTFQISPHSHVFLGDGHERAERRTWAVIALCTIMMIAEIIGGALFGSLALIADGLHMSTHAGALLLAALAYTFARKYAADPNFTFGTGKFGDLAGYSSAIVLAMIALLIGYEAVLRFLDPVPIAFNEAIPIAVLGLAVNIVSAWLLAGGHHHGHGHDHGHSHGHSHHHDHEHDDGHDHAENRVDERHHRDNNMRAAVIHVAADAAVSVLVIAGLLLARAFGWLWMDPLAGLIGALVIASWSIGLLRDTGAILLDRMPQSKAKATGSPTCTSGGWGRDISAPLFQSRRPSHASPLTTGRDWPIFPTCRMSRSRSSTSRKPAVDSGGKQA
jgi:cation diffusion facilitator family transporter